MLNVNNHYVVTETMEFYKILLLSNKEIYFTKLAIIEIGNPIRLIADKKVRYKIH